MEGEKVFQAEVYAEGNVRITGQEEAPRNEYRATLRTARQVQVSPYQASGLTQLKEPPRGLLILERSGFARSEPAQTPAQAAPAPNCKHARCDRPRDRASCPIDSRLRLCPIPRPWSPSRSSPSPSEIHRSSGPGSTAKTWSRPRPRSPPEARPGQPRRGAPAASQPADSGEPPNIDLPPIEGAQDVEVPNLRNPEDVPRTQPLPGATEDQPAPPARPNRAGTEAKSRGPSPHGAAPAGLVPHHHHLASQRPQDGCPGPPRAGRRNAGLHHPGRSQHRHPDAQERDRGHRVRECRDLEAPRPQERGASTGAQWRVDRQSQSAHGGLPRGQCDPPPGREQGRGQGRPADLPRQAGLLRLRDRPGRRARWRGRRIRAGLHRADEAQVAPDRPVPQASSNVPTAP